MKANNQPKTMMDRSAIRERIVIKTAFFGAVALVVPNYFLHGALLSFGSDPRLTGVILGGLGCGIGAGIGYIIAVLVVPVAKRASDETFTASRIAGVLGGFTIWRRRILAIGSGCRTLIDMTVRGIGPRLGANSFHPRF